MTSSWGEFILPFFILYEWISFLTDGSYLALAFFAGWNHSLAFNPYFRSLSSFIPSLFYDFPSSLSPLRPMTVIFSKWIPSSRNESLLLYTIFGCNNMESTIVECQTKQSPLEKRVSSL